MSRTPSRTTLVFVSLFALLALGLAALPAAAEVYHVNLTNGAEFESRYPPEEASWDANTLLFITETGNWIGVPRAQIESVKAEVETRGHGTRLNSTTIYMGRAPNINQTPEQEASAQDRQLQYLQQLVEQQGQQQDFTVEQFVEPSEAGKAGGLPAGYGSGATAGGVTTIPIPVPAPAPAPAAPPPE